MTSVRLNLIVFRASAPEALARFYSILGIEFSEEKHGDGPVHYAANIAGTVFEIYPRSAKVGDTSGVRVGFRVADVGAVWHRAIWAWAEAMTPPETSPWGYRAVLKDPEGHVVEITDIATSGGPPSPFMGRGDREAVGGALVLSKKPH